MRKFLLGLLGCACFLKVAAANANWDFDHNVETFFEVSHQDVRSRVPTNLGNRILELPTDTRFFEIRPDLKFSSESAKFVFRPQWRYINSEIRKTGPDETYILNQGRIQLNDLYLENILSEKWTTTIGLQVYQWGPAELVNPSNPFFTFSRDQRGLYYKEKGKVLARAIWTATNNLNFTMILEPISNAEPLPREGERFNEKGLIKGEWRSDSSIDYVGIVSGKERDNRFFVGEYFNYSPREGFSFYADARHPQGYRAWIPTNDRFGFYRLQEDQIYEANSFYTIAVTGFRWEGRNDFRFEYIYNEVGWDKSLYNNAVTATTQVSPYIAGNITKFYRPGFDLISTKYLYASLRIPDLGKKNDVTLYFFDLHSLLDDSGLFQAAVDKPWNESVIVYGEAGANYGKDGTEFKLLTDSFIRAGLRYAF